MKAELIISVTSHVSTSARFLGRVLNITIAGDNNAASKH